MRIILVGALLAAAFACAQTPPPPDTPSTSANLGLGGIQRGLIYKPLSNEERWKLWLNTNFANPGAYLRAFGPAIADQSNGIPDSFPSGAKGYAARVGSRFGRFALAGTIQTTMGQALGHDPRYIASTRTGTWPRFRQAFLYNFLTYDRNGHTVLDVSTLTGQFVSEALFAHWSGQRWDVKGYQGLAQQFAFGWTINLAREYWPEIQRTLKFKKKKVKNLPPPSPVPQTTGSSIPASTQP